MGFPMISLRKPKLLDVFPYEFKGKLKLVLLFCFLSPHNFDIKFSYLYTKLTEISALVLHRLKGHCSRRKPVVPHFQLERVISHKVVT